MNKATSGMLCVALAFGGCVGPVEIAPLPYAHPANPEAPAGAMPAIGSALTPGPGEVGDSTGQASGAPGEQKCGAMPKKTGHEGHGR